MAAMKYVSHQQVTQLLHNKFIVVLGDSIQRSVYKDLVLLLQKESYLSSSQLKRKGEMSFEQDCLVEGGCLRPMHNGIDYREVRQFQSAHHLVRFYFVTRIYSCYMQSILQDFRSGLKPDVIVVNSCIWDISRYMSTGIKEYKDNLQKFFTELGEILPDKTLIIWNLTMPLGQRLRGGFLVPEIEHKAPQLRHDVIEANFYSAKLADSYGMDVLDLHYQFRYLLHHRTNDGVHWNAVAHRRITSLLLQHCAQAWGVDLPCSLTAVGEEQDLTQPTDVANRQSSQRNASRSAGLCRVSSSPLNGSFSYTASGNYSGYRQEFVNNYLPSGYFTWQQEQRSLFYKPVHYIEPNNDHRHQYVMRSRHSRHHYVPYIHHGSRQYGRYLHDY